MHFATHFDHPDDAAKLAANAKQIAHNDKFVEYIRHIDSKCTD